MRISDWSSDVCSSDLVDQTVARINEIGRSLSSLNSSLRRTADGTSQNAGLEDDRDRLLQELAGLVKIDAEIRPDGTVNVRLDNSNGPLLVDQMGPKLLGAAEAHGKIQQNGRGAGRGRGWQ